MRVILFVPLSNVTSHLQMAVTKIKINIRRKFPTMAQPTLHSSHIEAARTHTKTFAGGLS